MAAKTKLLVWALLAFGGPVTAQVNLFGGNQVQLFKTLELSRACAVALNTPLRCPTMVQSLSYPDYTLNMTTEKLDSFCGANCQTDIADVAERLALRCGGDVLNLQIGDISFAEFGEFIKHRSDLLCLKESPEGRFCQLAMTEWDISESNGNSVTWPEHTSKCWIDEETGDCFPEDEYAEDVSGDVPDWMFPADDYAAEDYFRDRSGVLEGAKWHSLGSSKSLDWDEYPLEVQCNRCFWKTFAMGQENQWSHMRWDPWTEQIWANMVRNCDIRGEERIITPFKNLTGIEPPPDNGPSIDWDLCPSTATIPTTNEDIIWEFAQKASLPMACVRRFNPVEYYTADSLRGRRLCLPLTCETAVVDEITNVQDFVEKKLEGVAMYQFLEWNQCLHKSSMLLRHDTVCLGPHRGRFTPTPTGVAQSTVFTTTATPDPTARPPPQTIRNCGLFHVVTESDTCAALSLRFRVTVNKLRNMNPTIDSECTNLSVGRSYCVAPVNGTEVPDVTTTYPAPPGTSGGAPQQRTAPTVLTTTSA
ncbi:LysM domain-containing protein [Colletotrichum orbiculare MAFF 240422]|uniref:LysM domain-containing protein n=1 Tax=Colletotrichum orbiculare (strain 104-T / ATCC 96160 / CBS 514.97 / LARS 414 / MAFF 240422) TaxID=1213857 RepID=N4VV44_COLOR|nr:LysM domain-containing protein [Colletotrichum orbiculare MAFF 240422]